MKKKFFKVVITGMLTGAITMPAHANVCTDSSLNQVISNLNRQIRFNQAEITSLEKSGNEIEELLSSQKNVANVATLSGSAGVAAGAGAAALLAGWAAVGAGAVALGARVSWVASKFKAIAFGRGGALAAREVAPVTATVVATSAAISPIGWWVLDRTDSNANFVSTFYVLSNEKLLEVLEADKSLTPAQIWTRVLAAQNEFVSNAEKTLRQDEAALLTNLENQDGVRAKIDQLLGRADVKEIEIMALFNDQVLLLKKENEKRLKGMIINIENSCAL